MKFDVIFINTFINDKNIYSLIDSINNCNSTLNIYLISVNQNFKIDESKLKLRYKQSKSFILNHSMNISLSNARNLAIKYILKNDIISDYVMMIDDDIIFDKVFFKNFRRYIKGNSIIRVLNEGTKKSYLRHDFNHSGIAGINQFKYACSVNIIITYMDFIKFGLFDQRLGIGGEYGSSEDIDYYIRVCKINLFNFVPQIHLFHPSIRSKINSQSLSKNIKRYKTYSEGLIFTLCKHKLYNMAFYKSLIAILGGFQSLFKLKFRLSILYFISSIYRFKIFIKCLII